MPLGLDKWRAPTRNEVVWCCPLIELKTGRKKKITFIYGDGHTKIVYPPFKHSRLSRG